MDRKTYIERRSRRVMAQILSMFDEEVGPWVPSDQAENFKREVRRRINSLSTDAVEVLELGEDAELNGVAIQIKDRTGVRTT